MKKIITIFENLEPVHLNKDVGMLPYSINADNEYDVQLITNAKKFNDTEFEKKVSIKFIRPFDNRKINKIILFLQTLSKINKVDVLILFHPTRDKYILSYLAKLLNKNLTVVIKMDTNELTAYEFTKQNNILLNYFATRGVDYFTIETKQTLEILKNTIPFKDKIYYLPNGFSADKIYDFSLPKEKMIISVGRVGTPQKNSELLLKAIELIEDLRGYKFYFIGPIQTSFQAKVNELFERRKDLKDSVILTGNITSKEVLFDYYKRAEFFCFTSIYESFGLTLVEAGYFGCKIITTDFASAFDITNNGQNGKIVEINKILINELQNKDINNIVSYVDNNFEKILMSKWFEDSSELFSKELQILLNSEIKSNVSKEIAKTIFNDFNWNKIAINFKKIIGLSK